MSTSPTQRTVREIRRLGGKCGIVERWNQHVGPAGVRQDLFGIIDIIWLDPSRGIVGVQSCGNSFAQHYQKLTVERYQDTLDWLQTPHAILELWAWRKVKVKRGGKAERWSPRREVITLEDLHVQDLRGQQESAV